ncbi:MAG: putative acetyltransferase [Frankiales bacterium]|jgi:aminoglycoside 2'-N-acetyltransferase I|nr:putative acetyltransferase [Frankiales bacterium]
MSASGFPAAEVRALPNASFEDVSDEDWAHCLGGLHVLLWDSGGLVGHAAVVPRTLWCEVRELQVG